MRNVLARLYQVGLRYLGLLTVMASVAAAGYLLIVAWPMVEQPWHLLAAFAGLGVVGILVSCPHVLPDSMANPCAGRHIVPSQIWAGIAAILPAAAFFGLSIALGGDEAARELAVALIVMLIMGPYVVLNGLSLLLSMWPERRRTGLTFK